ncbi:MAG: pentapeptide repeat-containing protein [Proteobacteria bacterium]|nr:pentapeptide repeat-containing protein [Pseudomonadota bacterium]
MNTELALVKAVGKQLLADQILPRTDKEPFRIELFGVQREVVVDSVDSGSSRSSSDKHAIYIGKDILFSAWEKSRRMNQTAREVVPRASAYVLTPNTPNGERIDDIWRDLSPRSGELAHNPRALLAGLPGTGKTLFLDYCRDKLYDNMANGRAGGKKSWQLPLWIEASSVLRIGWQQALIKGFNVQYNRDFSFELLEAAIRCGYLVLLIDDIGIWAVDEVLSTSTHLIAQLLSIVGPTGGFVATVDSRYIYKDMFDYWDAEEKRVQKNFTGLGERFQAADDVQLIELAPRIERQCSHVHDAVLTAYDSLPAVMAFGGSGFWSCVNTLIDKWAGEKDNQGVFGEAGRRKFIHTITLWLYHHDAHTIPYDAFRSLCYYALPENYRETFFIDHVARTIINSDLFVGSEGRGISFASGWLREAALAKALLDVHRESQTRKEFYEVLTQGYLYPRLAYLLFSSSDLSNPKRIVADVWGVIVTSRDLDRKSFMAVVHLIMASERIAEGRLSQVRLPKELDLTNAKLHGISLHNVLLERWIFREAIMTSASLRQCHLINCDFSGIYAPDMGFDCSHENALIFSGARLSGAEIRLKNLEGVTFSHADLTAAVVSAEENVEETLQDDALKRVFSQTIIANSKIEIEGREIIPKDTRVPDMDVGAIAWSVSDRDQMVIANRFVFEVSAVSDRRFRVKINDFRLGNNGTVEITTRPKEILFLGKNAEEIVFACYGGSGCSLVYWRLEGPGGADAIRARQLSSMSVHAVQRLDDRYLVVTDQGIHCLSDNGQKTTEGNIFYEHSGVKALLLTSTPRQFVIQSETMLRLVELAKSADGSFETKFIDEISLRGRPIIARGIGETVALAFEGGDVEIFSSRFGWVSRARHRLSFAVIDELIVAHNQANIYAVGRWKNEAGVALIDGVKGDLLVYYEVPKEALDTIQDRLIKSEFSIGIDSGRRKADLSNLETGFLDSSEESALSLLNRIKCINKSLALVVERDGEIVIDVVLRKDDQLSCLYTRYKNIDRSSEDIALSLELVVYNPIGELQQIPANRIHMTNRSPSIIRASCDFRPGQMGEFNLQARFSMGSAMHSIEVDSPFETYLSNPFQFSHGLDGEWLYLFKGHEKTIKYLLDNIDNQHIAIHGSRRQGKSSILYKFRQVSLQRRRDIIPLFISFDQLVEERHEVRGRRKAREDPLLFFARRVNEGIGENEQYRAVLPTREEINNPEKGRRYLLDVRDALKRGSFDRAKLVILADEANVLAALSPDEVNPLSSFIHDNLWIRLLSASLPYREKIDTRFASGIGRFLNNSHFIQPLDSEQIKELCKRPLGSRYTLTKAALDLVCQYSTGRPHDAQVLMYHAINESEDRGITEINCDMINWAYRSKLVPIYYDYLMPFREFEKFDYHTADNWFNDFEDDFEFYLKNINRKDVSENGAYRPFRDWGYVQGRDGNQLHIPHALASAWVERKKE